MNNVIECQAVRRGRAWVAHVSEHGVYGDGRTLKAVHANIRQGLELVGKNDEVVVVAASPELDRLRDAQDAYTEALRVAVSSLALRRAPLADIAAATGVRRSVVKAILAGLSQAPASPTEQSGVPVGSGAGPEAQAPVRPWCSWTSRTPCEGGPAVNS